MWYRGAVLRLYEVDERRPKWNMISTRGEVHFQKDIKRPHSGEVEEMGTASLFPFFCNVATTK